MNDTAFEWPAPPYFTYAEDGGRTGPEPCLIYFRDGKKLLGHLERFLPEELSLVFQPTRTEVHEIIDLDQIKSLRLVHPLKLKSEELSLSERADEIFHGSDKQSFVVAFNDQETMKGETVGYTIGRNGLYLFTPSEKEKIIRCFVPYVSIKDYQIGPRIGELLIDQVRHFNEQVAQAHQLIIQVAMHGHEGNLLATVINPACGDA